MRRRGFTLIELLVVIAIIAILAAILFPVFTQTREKGRQTRCGSNMKQLGMAVLQYMQDYQGTYPNIGEYVPGSSGDIYFSWAYLIMPYVKNIAIFSCPSDHRINPNEELRSQPRCSYSGNGILFGAFGYPGALYSPKSWKDGEVVTATRVVMMWDDSVITEYSTVYWPDWFQQIPTWRSQWNPLLARHSPGDNFLFADGHVKWYVTAGQVLPRNMEWHWDKHKISTVPSYRP